MRSTRSSLSASRTSSSPTPEHVAPRRARPIGINHIAIEVGNLEEALAFYGRILDLRLREHESDEPWIDLGDQVLAVFEGDGRGADAERHFGLVVDDLEAVRAALRREQIDVSGERQLDFHDPWGNRVQISQYGDVRFRKASEYLDELLG
jgi:lactoylglutathione lyase